MAVKAQSKTLRTELDEALQDIQSVRHALTDAYTPEADRADLVAAIAEALDVLEDYDEDEAGDADED
jgi:hypothetical protein